MRCVLKCDAAREWRLSFVRESFIVIVTFGYKASNKCRKKETNSFSVVFFTSPFHRKCRHFCQWKKEQKAKWIKREQPRIAIVEWKTFSCESMTIRKKITFRTSFGSVQTAIDSFFCSSLVRLFFWNRPKIESIKIPFVSAETFLNDIVVDVENCFEKFLIRFGSIDKNPFKEWPEDK